MKGMTGTPAKSASSVKNAKTLKFDLTFYIHVPAMTCKKFLTNVIYPIQLWNINRCQENQLVYYKFIPGY